MTCRHAAGDPNCSSTQRARQHARDLKEERERRRAEAKTPDAEKYEVIEAEAVGPHLVMKVNYPNCAKCSYEGNKVLVFLDTTTLDALRWRRIDPHFRAPPPTRARTEAPSPAARFPASNDGWADAITYARGKDAAPKRSTVK